MFSRTYSLNAAKVAMPLLGRPFLWYTAGVVLRRQYRDINVFLPRYVGHLENDPAGGVPKQGWRCGVEDKCCREYGVTGKKCRWVACASPMNRLRCFPCYYGGLHWMVTPRSYGSSIIEGTWRYHGWMAGYVGEAV